MAITFYTLFGAITEMIAILLFFDNCLLCTIAILVILRFQDCFGPLTSLPLLIPYKYFMATFASSTFALDGIA